MSSKDNTQDTVLAAAAAAAATTAAATADTILPRPTLQLNECGRELNQEVRFSGTAFPRVPDKMGDDDSLGHKSTARTLKARQSGGVERSSTQAASSGSGKAAVGSTDGRNRSKSRSRVSSKITPVITQQHSVGNNSTSNSSDTTISELQQRLETMAREKVSLECAIEHEQERVFNQSRRLSGSMSPMLHISSTGIPGGIGHSAGVPSAPVAAGAVSPRWVKSHSRSSSVSSFGGASASSVGITETLKADVNSLRLRLADAERELVSCYNQSQIYKKELVSLRQRLGMRVDDLYLDDPVPSSIRSAISDGATRPRRSQSVSSGASSTASTPSSLARRGSGHHHDYFVLPPTTPGSSGAGVLGAGGSSTGSSRRISRRPRSVLLSPRRSLEEHNISAGGSESLSLFAPKPSAPQLQRGGRNPK
ncbi:hypothetical protein IW140_002707 [Coemansia sp. RSA 1813]|nr:hypothetical protein EV178_000217 [Coemansia sp. RSA 1646]KAJ1769536.1 hypothetical protein LPJ74_003956 [Coemansia sp. RSA 1843]KAJ2090474.1 hypothetical protein IW138_002686 [Coemansia sp. RSA 986]KAJ2215441.1 hypothetical protein EV179_002226 [Coemansia sp. RSA 487]KAJ2570030.1 hypothetical protein IW140_002707 [Coemansia sp. RSA 1813]